MKSIIDELIKQKLLKLNQAQVWWAIIIKNAKFYLKNEQNFLPKKFPPLGSPLKIVNDH